MFLRRKTKLNLIDNYVSIYRILYNCKIILSKTSNTENIKAIETLCDKTLDLKTKYERSFRQLKMYDSSFLNLKAELDNCKNITRYFTPFSIKQLESSLELLETDINKLKLNIT